MKDAVEPQARRQARGGFSMVEVVIALIILMVGVLGLAGTTAFIVRQVTLSDLMTERTAAFQTVIDRLQSLPYDSVASGSDSIGIFLATWTSTTSGGQNKLVQIITTGPGVTSVAGAAPLSAPQVVDTFTFRILRR
jgi:Tfp pilus assembly protein PilV